MREIQFVKQIALGAMKMEGNSTPRKRLPPSVPFISVHSDAIGDKRKGRKMDNEGIDPPTYRMQSDRSTI